MYKFRQQVTAMSYRFIPLVLSTAAALSQALAAPQPAAAGVRVWEAKAQIPTYLAGPPEPNPMFFFNRQSQGAEGRIYPYPFYDTLTGQKVNKTYTLVYLENEYIRIAIMPEIGGRIFEGVDKTNNYNFFYRQHVIKPALIGLIGAWISGGIEWNIPHHHRASTFLPVQYRVEESPDGSKTVWVGELELRDRMRWAVGYTLRPGKAYLEAQLRIVNRTPLPNTMLCFANVAVHVDDSYQVIFPPSTQYATYHSKREFTAWPFSTSRFNNADFTKGVDVSWYKNNENANSFFAWNYEDDFFAGYDHGKQAGLMSVADHHLVPGKKLWTWGTGPRGRSWDKILSDTDGPYIELMVGAYSDNQPDYTWMQPFEGRSFSMNWYPFRDIGGVKNANLDAAVNLDMEKNTARFGFYTTSARPAATARLQAGGKTLFEQRISINPGKPFKAEIAVPAGIDAQTVRASLWDGGKELVAYSPIRLQPAPMPEPVTDYEPPSALKTNEELYLTGLRIQQFHDPSLEPEPYWEEALRRDPGDARVNTAMGITLYKKARYADAERHLRAASERLTARHTTPKDGEAAYYLGLALKAQGKLDEAFAVLARATWSLSFRGPGNFALAEIAASRGDTLEALNLVERAIEVNTLSTRAQNLKAALLRRLGRSKEALEVLNGPSRKADPLDVRAMSERWLISRSPADAKALASTLNQHPSTALETAAEYMNAGLWKDGTDVLTHMTANAADKTKLNAMVYYYLGYFAARLGQPRQAAEHYAAASKLPSDLVFPFQAEMIAVFRDAMQANPRDARAPFYLGNLLYDWQPEEATRLWQTAASLDPNHPVTRRNLAVALMHRKSGPDIQGAIAELEKAVAGQPRYALHFAELDELYEQARTPLEKRLPLFEQNKAVIARRDDALNRGIMLEIALGRYDDAISTLSTRSFAVAEGVNLNIVDRWLDAHLLRGQQRIAERRYKEALADFQAALIIPSNIPIENMSLGARAAEIEYWTGVAYEGLGERAQAEQSWRKGAAAGQQAASRRQFSGFAQPGGGPQSYFEGLCLAKLGQGDKARAIFERLVHAAQESRQQAASAAPSGGRRRRFAGNREANFYYIAGLGYLGLNDRSKAKEALTQAVAASPDLLGARTALASLR